MTNFQDLFAKVKNLVAVAPVLGAISRPAVRDLKIEVKIAFVFNILLVTSHILRVF